MPVSKKPRRKTRDASSGKRKPWGQFGLRQMAALIAVVVGAVLVFAYVDRAYIDNGAHLDVQVPELSSSASQGAGIFADSCASCHGANAAGSSKGPPLVHRYYEPNHHSDSAFYAAVGRGVRAHHWTYGDMPPVAGISETNIGLVVRYVRELQKANGIF